MRRFATILLLFFCLPSVQYAQWPTSTRTDSALVINFGFQAEVLTFEDGSSIFSHGVSNSVYLTKLDSRGFRVWPQYVVAHRNDSSRFSGGALIISDGAKGAIVGWADYRGALINPNNGQFYNNAFYMQKVDSTGVVRWRNGGVVAIPAISGSKGGMIVTDGAGGAIYATSEKGFDYPGAPNRERLVAVRINRNGQKLWETTTDTSLLPNKILFSGVVRAGRYVYIRFLDYRVNTLGEYFTRIVDTSGIVSSISWAGYHFVLSWRDSVLFDLPYNTTRQRILTKLSSSGDTLWSTVFLLPSNCQAPSPFINAALITDRRGGMFLLSGCRDTVLRFRGTSGYVERLVFIGMDSLGGYAFPDGADGIVLAHWTGKAQRYDSLGVPRWGTRPIIFQSDPENSYFDDFWGDNNGGVITTFWTTSRGLSGQHTGRYGVPGVTPVLEASYPIPESFSLSQNYPNPFNSSTNIQYAVARSRLVTIEVFDVLGRHVRTIVDQIHEPGKYRVALDASDLSSGIYFYGLRVEGKSLLTKKMVLIR